MPSKKEKKAGISKQKFDRCVSHVGTGGGKNPYAICHATFNKAIARKKMMKG